MVTGRKWTILAGVAALGLLGVCPAQAVDYVVPWWTDANPHTGAYGEQWGAYRNNDFSPWSAAAHKPMEWNGAEGRWELGTNTYKDYVLTNPNNQTPMSALGVELVTPGDYSWDGIVQVAPLQNLRTRCYAVKWEAGEGGALTAIVGVSTNTGEVINWDLGAEPALQNMTMAAGERLGFLAYSPPDVDTLYGVQATFNIEANDPAKLVGPVPEPATLALLAIGGVALIRRKK